MEGSVFRRCACCDPKTGKKLEAKRPQLKRRDHGAHWARYDEPVAAGGKRRQRRIGPCTTKDLAQRKLVEALGKIDSGTTSYAGTMSRRSTPPCGRSAGRPRNPHRPCSADCSLPVPTHRKPAGHCTGPGSAASTPCCRPTSTPRSAAAPLPGTRQATSNSICEDLHAASEVVKIGFCLPQRVFESKQ